MNILHIQTSMGPAGNAAFRLHSAMLDYGLGSHMLTYMPTVSRAYVSNLKQTPILMIKKVINNTRSLLVRKQLVADAYQYSLYPILGANIVRRPEVKEADVIYLHWIAGNFLSLSDIKALAQTGKPIVFFMHDMMIFTGGCHHSLDCRQYETGCQRCPMFQKAQCIVKKESLRRYKVLQKYNNLFFISPSKWMADCARRSYILANKQIFDIPNIVDEHRFKPFDKTFAKQVLNIPTNKFVITFGCQAGIKNRFKGWIYLRDALNKLKVDDIHCIIYGCDYNEDTVRQLKHPVQFIGPVFDETVLALICNASDLFVSPSLAESFGLTFLENIMCGTPVVGFNCTAIPETVHHGVNGYLAKYKDVDDLCTGITALYTGKMTTKKEHLLTSMQKVKMHLDVIKSIME